MEKIVALVILAVLSLLTPLLEIVVTGRIEPFGKFYQVNMFLSVGAVYWWYYVDKKQREFHSGPMLNVGVIALTIIALPIYFIRSRGWKDGGILLVKALGFWVLIIALAFLGETIGTAITA